MQLRQQSSASITTASKQILGPSPRRVGVIFSALPGTEENGSPVKVVVNDANTATTGVKASYTVPAGKTAILNAATAFATAGTTQVLQLQIVTGGLTITLLQAAPSATSNIDFTLSAGDVVQWNCTAAVAATTEDLLIAVTEYSSVGRITLSFNGTAILDQGININPGADGLLITGEHIGQAIQEEINAIASAGTITLGWVEIMELDCDCPAGRRIERNLRT